ncbi:hypothetical protein D1872_193560 [compost metagenome]
MFGYGAYGFADYQALYNLSTNLVLLIVLALCATPLPRRALSYIRERCNMVGTIVVPVIYFIFMFLSTAYLVNETYTPFLYFRF